jgi:hypothetical protein
MITEERVRGVRVDRFAGLRGVVVWCVVVRGGRRRLLLVSESPPYASPNHSSGREACAQGETFSH